MSTKVTTYLYDREFDIVILEGNRVNLPMYRNNIKIFKGVNNKIDFVLRDSDRKPLKIFESNLIVYIVDQEDRELVLKRCADIVDDRKSMYRLRLYPGDLENWRPGQYTFSVVLQDCDGDETMLYTDTAQNAIGVLELSNQPLPDFSPSIEILEGDFIATDNPTTFVTGRYPGDAATNSQDCLHTAALYMSGYTGQVIIQGSLEEYPSTNAQWFDITAIDYTSFTGIDPVNFEGNFIWIRFKRIDDAGNTGTFDKIWFKK